MVWRPRSRAGSGPAPRPGGGAERFVKGSAVGAALLAVPCATAMGQMSYESEMQAAESAAASSYETTAVLREDASGPKLPEGAAEFVDPKVPVPATWRAADGSAHDGDVLVGPELTAGAEVAVWLDSDGDLTAEPATQSEIVSNSVMESIRNLVFIELAVLAGYWLVLRLIRRARPGPPTSPHARP